MKKARRIIHLGFLGGFIMPPLVWLLSIAYLGIVSPSEVIQVATSPFLAIYVVGYNLLVYFLVHNRLNRIDRYLRSPTPDKLSQVQKDISWLPTFYIIAQILYCLIGPNTGMIGHDFLSPTEYLLGELEFNFESSSTSLK